MSVTKTEINRRIAPELVEDLRDYPDGIRLTTEELIADSFYADQLFTEDAMEQIRKRLFALSKRKKIVLEKQKDGSFIVHNEDAKFTCPHCGSKNTAPILYGYPAFSPQMEKKLNEGRLHLGGCCIMGNDPDRYCNDCQKEFSTFPNVWDILNDVIHEDPSEFEIGRSLPEKIGNAESVTYLSNFFNRDSLLIQIKHGSDGAVVSCWRGDFFSDKSARNHNYEISESEWNGLIHGLYDEFKFHEWDLKYVDPNVPDGTGWEVTVQFPEDRIQTRRGINAYPACWDDFGKLMSGFFEDKNRSTS